MAKGTRTIADAALARLFLHDTFVQLYLAVVATEAVIYSVPLMNPGTLTAFGASPFEIPFLATAVAAGFYGLRRITDGEERLFWTHLAWAMVFWLATLTWIAFVPQAGWSAVHEVLVDASYLFFYSPILFALERKPHLQQAERQRELERQLRWAGVTLLVVGWFAYFIAAPVLMDPAIFRTRMPSLLLFITIDAGLIIRVGWRAWSCGSVRWRVLYGALAAAAFSLLGTDLLDVAHIAGLVDIRPGATTDLIWAIPPFLFVIAFRLRESDLPRSVDALVRDRDAQRSLDPVRVGSFLVGAAMAFPLVHFAVHSVASFRTDLVHVHQGIVLAAAAALAGLAAVAYRVLERERMTSERARAALEERLRQARKLEATSRLSGVIASEFSSPLHTLTIFTDRALDALAPGDPLRDEVQRASEQVARLSEFTRGLSAVSRQHRGRPIRIDLAMAVSDVIPALREALGPSIRIESSHGSGSITVFDPTQLEAVLLDLATNARDAMPHGGRLRIETGPINLGSMAAYALAVRPGRYVRLVVTDTGSGIPTDVLAHVFEPFYTTKTGERGAGLGLATVYAIVSQHGGCISVRTSGGGTALEILLPAAPSP